MIDVVMPQMGESIVEGTLTKWLKKPGERVERDEPLFEISTDKVDTEIPSPAAGTLAEVLVEEGKTVGINTVVARIDEGGGAAAAPPRPLPSRAAAGRAAAAGDRPADAAAAAAGRGHRAAPPAPAPSPRAAAPRRSPPSRGDRPGPLSPLVRKMARENNIDLDAGEGHRRRRTHHQAGCGSLHGAAGRRARPLRAAAPAAPARSSAARPRLPRRSAPPRRCLAGGQAKTRIEPMSTMRQKIAEHMVMSKRTSRARHHCPQRRHDEGREDAREAQGDSSRRSYGFSLTYLPFIARAAVAALRQFPLLNASIEGNNIVYHNEINIGIAVALENGLIVPVIRNADEKNVLGLQRSIVDLAARARSRQLKPDEVHGRHVLDHQLRQLRQPVRRRR